MILTAAMVVASWISLQYYGSSVAPTPFGAGNKLLHNVTAGMGVVEGNGGRLRADLPWHQLLRLSVLLDAPRESIIAIIERHPSLRSLFEQRWMHLFALDERGRMAWRYVGDLRWGPTSAIKTSASVQEAEQA